MALLERDAQLAALESALNEARAGQGRVVLVSGEAGIGKTSLVQRFVVEQQPAMRVLWGACDALFTPRPLGPLYDMALDAGSDLRVVLEGEVSWPSVSAAFLSDLRLHSAPTIVVFEDMHWADEATLDLFRFLARRIQQTTTLL